MEWSRNLVRRLTLGVANVGPLRSAVFQMLSVRQATIDGGLERTTPGPVEGFEDLAFLFSSNLFNYRVAGLRFNEAAYLWKLARTLPKGAVVAELGRFQGGSTFLLAAALKDGDVYSYDLPVRYRRDGYELDRLLETTIERAQLAARVHLLTEDSRTARPPGECALVFVDGDHSYAGARADFHHWRTHVKQGGHLVFHDAIEVPDLLPSAEPGVARLMTEVAADNEFREQPASGTLAHFVRI